MISSQIQMYPCAAEKIFNLIVFIVIIDPTLITVIIDLFNLFLFFVFLISFYPPLSFLVYFYKTFLNEIYVNAMVS